VSECMNRWTWAIAREKSPLAPLYEKGSWGDFSGLGANSTFKGTALYLGRTMPQSPAAAADMAVPSVAGLRLGN